MEKRFDVRLLADTEAHVKEPMVMKFGGTSVGSARAIERVVSIVKSYKREQEGPLVIVVSAVRGVTDALVRVCNMIEQENEAEVELALEDIITKHESIVEDIELSRPLRSVLDQRFNALFRNLWMKCLPIRPFNPERRDEILGYGERLNAPLVAYALIENGVLSESVEAIECIETDSSFGDANPDLEKTCLYTRRKLLPMLDAGIVPVVTGFIGATRDYKPTTLGRGGSDYTASLLAASLPASELWIWTDVDGVFDKDPHIHKDARILEVLTQTEANRMALNGAKVLYPKTLLPLMGLPIPVRVKNTFNPEFNGSLIVD